MNKNDFEYKELPKFEIKRYPSFVKEYDEDQGVVTHIVAVMGNIDDVDDRIEPGAFVKSISERGMRIKVLDQHRNDSVLCTVGKPLEMREIGRNEFPDELVQQFPSATGALQATTQYAMKTTRGREVFELVKGGFLPECSIGYDAIQTEYTKEIVNGEEKTIRLLKEIRLWEYSNVLWGANAATTTISAKSSDPLGETAPKSTKERKDAAQILVDTLRAALVEAEAILAGSLPADDEDPIVPPVVPIVPPEPDPSTPAEAAGRDDNADDQGAGPEDTPPTAEETERVRQELLTQIESFEED